MGQLTGNSGNPGGNGGAPGSGGGPSGGGSNNGGPSGGRPPHASPGNGPPGGGYPGGGGGAGGGPGGSPGSPDPSGGDRGSGHAGGGGGGGDGPGGGGGDNSSHGAAPRETGVPRSSEDKRKDRAERIKQANDVYIKHWSIKDMSFSRADKLYRIWGSILHPKFGKILDETENVEDPSAPIGFSTFTGVIDDEDDYKWLDEQFYIALMRAAADDVLQNLVENTSHSGVTAWRRLSGRYNPHQAVDRCFEYEEVTKPTTWLSRAKSFKHAIDVLAQYEAKVAKFENKYGEPLDERAK